MIFEYLPNLANYTDYLPDVDLSKWTNWLVVDVSEWRFEFTPFQLHIFQLFVAILCVVVALIVVFWLRYGEVISERFIRPSEYKNVTTFGAIQREEPIILTRV